MKKQNSTNSAQFKRASARLLSDISSVPSRIHKHVIKPIQTSTGHSLNAARRASAPTVGSVASFMAAIFGLDESRKQHTA